MTQAASAYTAPSLNTPKPHKTSLRSYLIEGTLVTWVLVCAAALGCLVADHVEGKISARCAASMEGAQSARGYLGMPWPHWRRRRSPEPCVKTWNGAFSQASVSAPPRSGAPVAG
jgi:hypothetical protein